VSSPLFKGNFGLFNHYLYGNENWVKTTNDLDISAWAKRIADTGASRFCVTLMQGNKYMLAPNATYDRIAGTKPGEACCLRDVPMELGLELKKYDIDLYLYYTGDGPHFDDVIGRRFGMVVPELPEDENAKHLATPFFVKNWAAVLEEYAVRYGDLVKGWWIDGCYHNSLGYTDELLAPYYEAIKKGNPHALVAMNNGCPPDEPKKNYCREDYTCGEIVDFTVVPSKPTADGALMHILTPLGMPPEGQPYYDSWCRHGIKRDAAYLAEYIRKLQQVPCALTIDIWVGPDGSFDEKQVDTLRKTSELLQAKS